MSKAGRNRLRFDSKMLAACTFGSVGFNSYCFVNFAVQVVRHLQHVTLLGYFQA